VLSIVKSHQVVSSTVAYMFLRGRRVIAVSSCTADASADLSLRNAKRAELSVGFTCFVHNFRVPAYRTMQCSILLENKYLFRDDRFFQFDLSRARNVSAQQGLHSTLEPLQSSSNVFSDHGKFDIIMFRTLGNNGVTST
jgi:hypothetical protein